jgi:hypothetical protein
MQQFCKLQRLVQFRYEALDLLPHIPYNTLVWRKYAESDAKSKAPRQGIQ